MTQLEQHRSYQSRTMRSLAFAVAIGVHVGIFLVVANGQVDAVVAPDVAYLIDVRSESSPRNDARLVPVKLLAPSPPQVPMPKIIVDDTQVTVEADRLTLVAALPTALEISDIDGSSGSNLGVEAQVPGGGDIGQGSSASPFAVCKNRVMPAYPENARLKGESGRLMLLVILDKRGRFESIDVLRSSGSVTLDAAGVAAVKRWRCSPVFEHGRAVRAITKQEFEFVLKDGLISVE